ncbi:MAG: hypothetical protein BWZ10_01317 [candidate division BRC1 bacterium ADurb.BinA364]|nr:MAG: hypothetical protein BWZ10_01317 [candidate division BRC1 bacterium ADurb.BinA364]
MSRARRAVKRPARNASRRKETVSHGQRLFDLDASRAPALRAASRIRGFSRRRLALRGDHRDLHSAFACAGRLRARRRRFPADDVDDAAVVRNAGRRSVALALCAQHRKIDRAGGEGNVSHALHAEIPRMRADVFAQIPRLPPYLCGTLRPRSGEGVPPVPGRGQAGNRDLRRHPRFFAADAGESLRRSGPSSGGARQLPETFRADAARDVERRMRLFSRPRRYAERSRHPLLLRRCPRHPLRRQTARQWRLRSAVLPQRRRRLRPRSRILEIGLELQGRLSGRSLVSRILPGRGLRSRFRIHPPLHSRKRHPQKHGHQVLPHHQRGAGRQGALRGENRAGARRGPCRQFHVQSRTADRASRALHGPPADRRLALRRRAVRPLVVRRAELHRFSVPKNPLRPENHRAADADGIPRTAPGQPIGHAVVFQLGLQGLRRVLARREQRLDLSPLARSGRPHDGSGAAIRGRRRRAETPGAAPGRPRAAARPGQRLGLHHANRHGRALRRTAHPRASLALQRPLRNADARRNR